MSERADLLKDAYSVCDESGFVDFLQILQKEWEIESGRNASDVGETRDEWENLTFGSILEGAVACWHDNQNTVQHKDADGNPWRAAAIILWRGLYYE